MWLFSTLGFVSMVNVRPVDVPTPPSGGRRPRGGRGYLVLRFRDRRSADAYHAKVVAASVGMSPSNRYVSPVVRTPGRDYLYRFFPTRAAAEGAICGAISDIGYENFKNAASAFWCADYHKFLMSVWDAGWCFQERGAS